MLRCLAIYPHDINDNYINNIKNTLKLANKYNYQEIFTTIHLPEYSFENQIRCLKLLFNEMKHYSFDLTVDVGGEYFKYILSDKTILNDIKIDYIRLDYGFDFKQVRDLYYLLKLKGFVLNASIYNDKEFENIINELNKIDHNISIRACHNYYIKEESGIDDIYAFKQDDYISKYNIPIYYCIPTYSNPRGPLYKGLCTIENHRFKSIIYIISDLVLNHNSSAYMIADEWLSEDEFIEIEKIFKYLYMDLSKIEIIKIKFFNNISDDERRIVLKEHVFRNDSPFNSLRSTSSREMAESGELINKNNIFDIKPGYITINNKLLKRYSGELEVSMIDKKAKEDTNVIARIVDKYDLIKLWRFKENIKYRFVEE